MPQWMMLMLLLQVTWLLFAMTLGACVGSLINVLAYRMPLGISVVSPPSRCPACGTRLTWRENIPVFGWLLLRGKCRFCKASISPEYPLVEATVAVLFGILYAVCFMLRPDATWLGVDWGLMRPDWALGDWRYTWALFIPVLAIFGSLAAMTLVDAKTFTIPLPLAWFPTVVGLLAHTAWGIKIDIDPGSLPQTAQGWNWSIATFGWGGIGVGIGGVVGIGVSLLLLKLGWITRSFDDYEAWEKEAFGDEAEQPQAEPVRTRSTARTLIVLAALVACPVAGVFVAPRFGFVPGAGLLIGAVVGPLVGGILTVPFRLGQASASGETDETPAAMWTQYPHARREMIKELAFLAPIAVLGFAGWRLAIWHAGPWQAHPVTGAWLPSVEAPLWLTVVGGVLMGYLIGGGVVWGVRILGSLAFGKEAMGLGDVHLMAAVGACLGWIDSTIAFFLAAFVGVYWAILGRIYSGGLARAMPYGPFLAVATLLVFLGKPVIELVLTRIGGFSTPVTIP